MKKFELAPLPYAYNALEPIVSAETLKFHHDKHHQAYVNKLNELIVGTEFENSSLDDIVLKSNGPIFNNAGQVWNHDFYWKSMSPQSAQRDPRGKLLQAIESSFGSLKDFKSEFEKKGLGVFGSGWVWLAASPQGKLQIVPTQGAENPIRTGLTPLFTCDVWEHAYYIDYRNLRADYLAKFWTITNWDFAEANFQRIAG